MTWEETFENAWAVREDKIYRDFFGAHSGGIYSLDAAVFAFAKVEVDPRWVTHGVIKFPPNETRATWLYVTSGLSNAWLDSEPHPEGWSGLGCEFVLETTGDFAWAVELMRRLLAIQILLGWGHYEEKEPLTTGDRVPLAGPIDGRQSALTWVMLAPPAHAAGFLLPTGRTEFFHLVGITEAEAAFAREHGYESLLEKLTPAGYPVTRPERTSAV